MKKAIFTGGMLMGLFLLVSPVQAQDEGASGEAVESAQPTEAGNKICPVSGEEIGSMGEGFKIEYNGVIYNLCCPGCEKDFLKEPDKYIQKINEELEQETVVE